MKNQEVRNCMYEAHLRYWKVAEKIGISSSRFSVWLRTPLSDERRKRVEKAIDELSQSVKQ